VSRSDIAAYRRRIADLRARSGSANEGVVSDAFRDLLERMGRKHDLMLIPQWERQGARGLIRVDGALAPAAGRIPFGFWEAKDQHDDLDREIVAKQRAGYPDDNIIYEDTREAVLIQNGKRIDRAPLQGDDDALLALLDRFFGYQRAEVAEFKRAAAQFRKDLPDILTALRAALDEAERNNADYAHAAAGFLSHARAAIHRSVSPGDVREMLIQHILTEAIFTRVFDNAGFHRENNVAQRLQALEDLFFRGDLRARTVDRLKPYYGAITAAAANLPSRTEKQAFLKSLYEDFYKVYNPKAADRLGVVYTPVEIVRFMIRGAEWLLERHWGTVLADPGVEILDPATGTGTFVVELLEHMSGAGADRLRAKYREELHANEVAILPYYVANLNIEATYAAIAGHYAEFDGLCFVDTLDNTAGLGMYAGHQGDMLGGLSDENIGRIKRQNERKISVVIGNPPYNAWQQDYNARNPNRPYQQVDRRIRDSYRRLSRATNTSALSDMYVRFFRWASDRIRDDGIVAFVCNRNFIEKVAFDGFRRAVAEEFAEIWVQDLGGDVRANPKISGTAHNVFGIQTGVCVVFMVRKGGKSRARKKTAAIRYARRPEDERRGDKLSFLSEAELSERGFRTVRAAANGAWLNQGADGWAAFLPLADPEAGPGDRAKPVEAIFRLTSNGVETHRDAWLWANDRRFLLKKAGHFIRQYERVRLGTISQAQSGLKWDRELDGHLQADVAKRVDRSVVHRGLYRPFTRKFVYLDEHLNGYLFRLPWMFKADEAQLGIVISDRGWRSSFAALAVDTVPDTHLIAAVDRFFVVTRHRYTRTGERVDNITDWALQQFQARYPDEAVTKDGIFAYVYAALHDPQWRETYAADLRREFPRIPLHDDFARWRDWGQMLLDLHIGYETAEPYPLTRVDTPPPPPRRVRGGGEPPPPGPPKPILKSHPDQGVIVLDSETQLTGVPAGAWAYRLGNRSGIDWVLDQHKEKRPRDPTVARLFNTYRFADHKERVIALLARVVTVSVRTVAIVEEMRAARQRSD
jgi:predicted helicase